MKARIQTLQAAFTCAAMVCLLTNSAYGQEAPPSQYEHIKGMEQFVGQWEGLTQPDEGESLPLFMDCKLSGNKSYAHLSFDIETEEGVANFGSILIGWDAPNKQQTMWAFWPEVQLKGNATIKGNTLAYSASGTLADGTKRTAEVVFVAKGDQVQVEVTKRRDGDEELPNQSFTFTRRESTASSR